MKKAIGIDIGGTNTKIGVISESGDVLHFNKFPTGSQTGFEEYTHRIARHINDALTKLKLTLDDIEGIGVGAPNGNSTNGMIESPPNLAWEDVNLIKSFQDELNFKNIKLENDANVAALGEKRWGACKDVSDFIVITLGTGVGTGIVTNNQLVRGSHGIAGEGGHIVVDTKGRPCNCGGRGHLECYASVRGIKTTTFIELEKEMSFKEISDLYHSGDKTLIDIVKRTAKYLGVGLAQMGGMLAPDKIILAGGVATLGEQFRKWTEEVYCSEVYAPFKDKTNIELSTISTAEGAVLGAASLIL